MRRLLGDPRCISKKRRQLRDRGGRLEGATYPISLVSGAKEQMSIDEFANGQRISCNGIYGTVVEKRSTRKRRLLLVKMDNGFTLKLNPHNLRLPETGAIAQAKARASASSA